ncbi:MAG: polysaccharide deacetylase family protein [Armatimonadetes bacterium]|nr:polysaccharide deacetylase family protein [Armatimonadota bacterium]
MRILFLFSAAILFSAFSPAVASPVAVICYHEICAAPRNDMETTPENFEGQLRYLKQHGYRTLSMDQLVAHVRGVHPAPEKSVVLTFDDGYEGVYRYAYPLLKRYGFHAVVFLVTAKVGSKGGKMQHLSWPQVCEMDRSKVVEAAVHCHAKHVKMAQAWDVERSKGQSGQDLIDDLRTARHLLQSNIHHAVNYLAWPYGSYNRELINGARQLGYQALVTTDYGVNPAGTDPDRIKRLRMSSRYDTPQRFASKLDAYRMQPAGRAEGGRSRHHSPAHVHSATVPRRSV